ncbi:hypothetical protein C0995_000822 [Termitomyces sp. Mi166|nr:hypothetical protein C0995_000822 [Termitomyces sp. Mi166\
MYRDLQSPIWGKEDKDFVVPQHILTRFTCVKEDGMTALHVMRALDPSQLFDLKQIAQYALIFGQPHNKERALPESPEAKGLYYYIGMDPNQVHLWKCMAAHGPLLPVPTATNIAPVESSVVAAMTVSGPSVPPGPVPASQEPATNSATGDVTMALESGEVPSETAGSGP